MRRLRIVSYAINGRGMGHLVRQLAILRWVRRTCAVLDVAVEAWVLTTSEADTLCRREGVPALKMPSKAMLRDAGIEPSRYLSVARSWVLQAIAGLQPDVLIVDTFAGGSFGELVSALELAKHRILVARRVRPGFEQDDPYRALLPLYDAVITPDDRGVGPILVRERHELLGREQARAALGVPEGKRAVYLTLGGGGDLAAAGTLPRLVDALHARDWHVVVGAGPLYVGEERRGPGITWLSRYVPVELFAGVDAAVAAAGYNTFHELMFSGVPTVFVPQPRIADDQTERAMRAQAAGAGRVAQSLDEVPDLLEAPGSAEAARALVPHNGARAAAFEVLGPVLPARDLQLAAAVLTPELLAGLDRLVLATVGGATAAAKGALALVRVLCGGTPDELRRRRAAALELSDLGHAVPDIDGPHFDDKVQAPAERLGRFVAACEQCGVPFTTAMRLTTALDKKFPAADGAAVLAAVEQLFPLWARFDDWMGVVTLLRAVPTQRTLTLAVFCDALAAWLASEEDLFDATRDFSRMEGQGVRPVAEVLRLLGPDGG